MTDYRRGLIRLAIAATLALVAWAPIIIGLAVYGP